MAGLDPAIHVFLALEEKQDVDARPEAGHDDLENRIFAHQTHFRVLATNFARALSLLRSLNSRGSRECRAFGAPAASCAKIKSTRVSTPQVRRNDPAFPARWLYDLFRALSGDRAFLSPSPLRSVSFLRASRQRRGVKTTRLCRPRPAHSSGAPSAAIAPRVQRP
jgi:hypothetical protein